MKEGIIKYCKDSIRERMQTLKVGMVALQNDANSNSKSSMGDKYETGRAMVHLEQENLSNQYQNLEKQWKALNEIVIKTSARVQLGSLVTTDAVAYFISIGLGKIVINGKTIYAVAANSPVGQAMLGKKEGDSFKMNNTSQVITTIE